MTPPQVSLALRSGASGFLYKDVGPDALVRAIRAVHDGNMLLAPRRGGLAGAFRRCGARARRLVRGPAAWLGRPWHADRPRA